MAVSKRVFIKIVLVILLGNDEILKWCYLNHDLIFKFLLLYLYKALNNWQIVLANIVNPASILPADVIALFV